MIAQRLCGERGMSNSFSKINVFKILQDHISTLKDYGQDSISKFDIFLFFILPLIISLLLICFRVYLNDDLTSLLITSFSIFAGLLFNLQILMFDIVCKLSNMDNLPKHLVTQRSFQRRITLLEYVAYNISFEILLCLSGVLFLAFSSLHDELLFQAIFSLAVFYIVFLFSLTLAMILRRVHGLIRDEIQIQKDIFSHKNNGS